jgi:hypothetical protein
MRNKITSAILRHVSEYGHPCQSTFYVNADNTVTVVTIMNDMGSDGYWVETFNAKMPIEEARAKWRTLSAMRRALYG